MTYKLAASDINTSNKLVSNGFIILFTLGVIFISMLFFPIKTIRHQVLKVTQPQAISLYYLKTLVKLYPKQGPLRLALIKQYIGLYQWMAAETEIEYLKQNPDMQIDAKLLTFQLQYTKAYQLPKGKSQTKSFKELRTNINNFTKLKLTKEQSLVLAEDALNLGLPGLALTFYQTVSDSTDVVLLKKIAIIALQTSQYTISADYYMKAAKLERTLEMKRICIIGALKALEAGNLFSQGIDIVKQLSVKIINNKTMLVFLTRFTLAANRPDLAQNYIKRALLMRGVVK
jgi:hypothetical protein